MKPLSAPLHLAMVTSKHVIAAGAAYALASRWVSKDILSAAFVALLCLQPTVVTALRVGSEQLFASALGAAASLLFLLLWPVNAWTVGATIGVTYIVAARLRWPYATLVVALFSALYMGVLAQNSVFETAFLRFQSVLLGCAVGLAVNAAFSPLLQGLNLERRVRRGLETSAELFARLEGVLAAGELAPLDELLDGFALTYRALVSWQDDTADMLHEVRLRLRLAGPAAESVNAADRALRALELAVHHMQDVAMACARLAGEAGGSNEWPHAARVVGAAHQGLLALAEGDRPAAQRHLASAESLARAGFARLVPVETGLAADDARWLLWVALVQCLAPLRDVARQAPLDLAWP